MTTDLAGADFRYGDFKSYEVARLWRDTLKAALESARQYREIAEDLGRQRDDAVAREQNALIEVARLTAKLEREP